MQPLLFRIIKAKHLHYLCEADQSLLDCEDILLLIFYFRSLTHYLANAKLALLLSSIAYLRIEFIKIVAERYKYRVQYFGFNGFLICHHAYQQL